MTLETLGSYIRKDHKLDQQVYHAIKIPYLRQQSTSLLESLRDYASQLGFLTLQAFIQVPLTSLIYQRADLGKLWVYSLNHLYEYEIQKLQNQEALIRQNQSGNIYSKLLQQDRTLETLQVASQNLKSLVA
jgi:hypothetical protein